LTHTGSVTGQALASVLSAGGGPGVSEEVPESTAVQPARIKLASRQALKKRSIVLIVSCYPFSGEKAENA
jgi:hypothetical protein